jgi:hypothetical protein
VLEDRKELVGEEEHKVEEVVPFGDTSNLVDHIVLQR